MAGSNGTRRGWVALLALFVLTGSCHDSPNPLGNDPPGGEATTPTVSTVAATGITTTTATVGGDVTSDGGAPITARGVVWSTSPTPTLRDDFSRDGTGAGPFVSEISGLSPEGTYYVRAYALNRMGSAYGEELSFTTEEGEYAITVLGWSEGLPTLGNAMDEQCRVAGSFHRGNNVFGSYVWEPGKGFRTIVPGHDASALAINLEGTVAGSAVVEGLEHAYTWSEAEGVRFYGPPAGTQFTSAYAGAINSHGVIVGSSSRYGEQGIAEMAPTLWRPDGEVIVLPNPGGGWALARGINDAGIVVGYAGGLNAAAWLAPDEDPILLGGGQAWAINNHGDITGVQQNQAVLWRDRQPTYLKALPGHNAATARSLTEPDDDGMIRVVGWSEPELWGPSVERRPVIWTVRGSDVQVAELYPPAGHPGAIAKAVKILNGEVVVVGTSYTQASAFAVMWSSSREVCRP
jgi:hypothetical protein